jgi:hypothetical protein
MFSDVNMLSANKILLAELCYLITLCVLYDILLSDNIMLSAENIFQNFYSFTNRNSTSIVCLLMLLFKISDPSTIGSETEPEPESELQQNFCLEAEPEPYKHFATPAIMP